MSGSPVLCRCCRVPVFGMRQRFRVCPVCDLCDERHGHVLHAELIRRVHAGTIDPYLVVAVSAFDDAWLAGKMVIDANTGLARVLECPKRWEVCIAWCRAARQPVALASVLEAVLAPFMGSPNTEHVREQIAREMRIALCTADPNLADVTIESIKGDTIDRDEIVIRAIAKTPEPPLAVNVGNGPAVELPPDILSRPRGQA